MNFRSLVVLGCVSWIGCGGQSANTPPAQNNPPIARSDAETTERSMPPLAEGVTRCQQLMDRLCSDLGTETKTCELVRARTAELSERQCDAMTEHYDEVLADLEEYEAQNRPLSADRLARALEGATATLGPADAPITIVLFSDFQCPYCAGAAQTTHELSQRYGDKLRLVFRQFPLPFHRNAHVAAEASLAAAAQGKFWPMHDRLFANQQELDRASLSHHARTLGLDVAEFDRALDAQTYAASVDADLQLGVDLGVNGTPTMFINGGRVPNASDVDAVAAQIDAALSEAAQVTTH